MLNIAMALALLAALFVTYWVNPTAAWVVLGSGATLALARHVRLKDDEAERALDRGHNR